MNLEYLARVVEDRDGVAFPDTLVGTDSHTTMVNGLGVLGWGVGGIEAEAAMLGQPLSMLVPQVVGFRLQRQLRDGATATDLVLTVTEMLRKTGVVGKFVEYFGDGLAGLSLADRATIGNMSPEYGATCGFFPVDEVTLDYLRLTGRSEERIALVEAYCKENLLWHEPGRARRPTRRSSSSTSATSSRRSPGRAARRTACRSRGRRRVPRGAAAPSASTTRTAHTTARSPRRSLRPTRRPSSSPAGTPEPVPDLVAGDRRRRRRHPRTPVAGTDFELDHGSVVIAAITSCTNTSNPQVMVGAGLLAKKAVERGLDRKPWVKSSLAPGSKVVTELLRAAPGCSSTSTRSASTPSATAARPASATPARCADEISEAIAEGDLVVCSVLSGNRNFEARIHPEVKANYLASPPLVVAYALAGRMDIDFEHEPIGTGIGGRGRLPARHLADARRDRRDDCASRCEREHVRRDVRRRVHRRRGAGARCPCRPASCSPGSPTRRTCGSRRTSRA